MTPVYGGGNTHDSREVQGATFHRTHTGRISLPALNRRLLGVLESAISSSDLTIPLPTVDGLMAGESLEFGDGASELMRIESIDAATRTVTVAPRFQARGGTFVPPKSWAANTPVYQHRRSRPGRLPAYMVDSGNPPSFDVFRFTYSGEDVPYVAMNLHFPGGDDDFKDWEDLWVYLRLRRGDGSGTVIEGMLPLEVDGISPRGHRVGGDPYTLREQRLRRYLGWPENLSDLPRGALEVAYVDDTRRSGQFMDGPERTFLQELIDWVYADDGYDLGRIYPEDDRYAADEVQELSGSAASASEDLVRSYQVFVDIALVDGTDPRIDVDASTVALLRQPAWSATLTVGEDTSTVPASSGFSPYTSMGSLTARDFASDGVRNRVLLLVKQGDGLHLHLHREMTTDFKLLVGDQEFVASESTEPSYGAGAGRYRWEAASLDWSAADTLETQIIPLDGEAAERPTSPLTAFALGVPDSHDGATGFAFRLYFFEEAPISFRTLKYHAVEATSGAVVRTKRAVAGSSRQWLVAIRPDSHSNVAVTVAATSDCAEDSAICTDDGRMLHNSIELTIIGPGT